MRTIDLYEACIEKELVSKPNNIAKVWRVVGLFVNKSDAENAIKLYKLVYKNAMGEKNLRGHSISKKSFPQNLRHRYYKRYYKNLDEFINDDLNIKHYLEINNLTAGEQLDEINQAKNKTEKDLRIIERMIKEYNDKLHFALMTSSTSEESIEKIEESINYLEGLRDEKTKFTM